MAGASVIGVVLRLDVRGWQGEAPLLPEAPVKSEEGRDGAHSFYYDLMPKGAVADVPLDVEAVSVRLASRLERCLLAEHSPLQACDLPFRLTLDIGVMFDADGTAFAMNFTPDFLRVSGEADMTVAVTHYPYEASSAPLSEDDL